MFRRVERRRIIVHVDLDAFYASVEVRDNPSLRGKPVVVGGASPRSVVTAASYEARRYKIHSAMPMAWAMRACPDLVIVPPRFSYYSQVSRQFFDVLARYSPLVEGLSLDEAFLDLTGTQALLGEPMDAVRRLRAEVREELGLAASAGIAPVKFAAKIASDLAKPDGQFEIADAQLHDVLDPLPVGRLFGVGKKTEQALHSYGVRTIRDLRLSPPGILRRALGDHADHLQALARGDDPREVIPDREAKSAGAEDTFDEDLDDLETIETHLLGQAERVAARLRRMDVCAGGVTLKYKLDDFRLVTRQTTLTRATDDGAVLFDAVRRLLHANRPPRPIRLCGVSAHALGPRPPPELFRQTEDKREKVNATLDAVRQRFGGDALVRARLLTLDGTVRGRRPK